MQVLKKIAEWQKCRKALGSSSLGFVPTMGALHGGHLSLVQKSLSENDSTIVSIFVNPTQFNDVLDLNTYPRVVEQDLALLQKEGVDYVFVPSVDEIYPEDDHFRMTESKISHGLCGTSRPGHFDGVLTVVLKFLNIVAPTRAYFGEKDFQQFLLIKSMVEYFFLPIEIVPVPTAREKDGLAMSSRNLLLKDQQRKLAGQFSWILHNAVTVKEAKEQMLAAGMTPDYLEERYGRRFASVKIGDVRLIDNVQI